MPRPYVSFDEVKAKVTIEDTFEHFGLADHFVRKGDKLVGVCPFPGHVHGPSPNPEQFIINERDGLQLFRCFGDCQTGGSVVDFVCRMTGYDLAHSRFWFAEHYGDRLNLTKPKPPSAPPLADDRRAIDGPPDARDSRESDDTAEKVSEAVELVPLTFSLNLDENCPYLAQRGLNAKTIKRFGLGLATRGSLKGYIAIPIRAYKQPAGENPVAYLGRWAGDDYAAHGKDRYIWPKGFPKSQVVFGINEALDRTAKHRPLIVVEGVFGALRLYQAGYKTAVAVFGSSLSQPQADILIDTGRDIVLMLDPNQAGKAGMWDACGKLVPKAFVRVVLLPEGTQPDTVAGNDLAACLSFLD